MKAYVTITNSDLTEGRGHQVPVGIFDNAEEAVEFAHGRGVQGADAEVECWEQRICLDRAGEVATALYKNQVWGFHFSRRTGVWRYGWADDRDLPENDPEFQKYLELKERFKDV